MFEVEDMPEIENASLRKKPPRFGAFSSSADPEKLALSAKGALVALIPIALWVSSSFGWDFTEIAAMEWVDDITKLVAAAMLVYGILRKLYYRFTKRSA